MAFESLLLFIALGLFTGFAAGLLGIGGGGLVVPFLTIIFSANDFPAAHIVHMAIATGLATVFFTAISSTYAHQKQGDIVWRTVLLLLPGICLGAWLGPMIASHMNAHILSLTFAVFISIAAFRMVYKSKKQKVRTMPDTPGMVATGGVIGTYGGLIGSTGTSITVPFLSSRSVPMNQTVGIAATLGIPVAFIGSLSNMFHGWSIPDLPSHTLGFIYVPAVLSLAAGTVIAAPFGARFAHRLNDRVLKTIFAILLVSLASYMLWNTLSA